MGIVLLAVIAALVAPSSATDTAKAPALGLPPLPEVKPASPLQVALGKKLFFDRRLSVNNTLSCAMCHIESQAFASVQTATAVGMEGRSLSRNTPTLLNVVYQRTLFHDGRENELSQQVWLHLLLANEMANPSIGSVIERIRGLEDYRGLFETAFEGAPPSMQTIGDAIAAYERTLISGNSRFDRWHFGRDERALDAREKLGFELFVGKAGCVRCHRIEERSALFTDHGFHNTGIGYAAARGRTRRKWNVELIPGIYATVDYEQMQSMSEKSANDLGRYDATRNPADIWSFRTPSLRNVSLTPPYMHNGSLLTLADVVDFYDRGGVPNEGLSPLIKPLVLTAAEKAAIVAFLGTLNGEQ